MKACVRGAELDVEAAYTMSLCIASVLCSVLVRGVSNDKTLQMQYLLARDANFTSTWSLHGVCRQLHDIFQVLTTIH